jgi:hypothetical protein
VLLQHLIPTKEIDPSISRRNFSYKNFFKYFDGQLPLHKKFTSKSYFPDCTRNYFHYLTSKKSPGYFPIYQNFLAVGYATRFNFFTYLFSSYKLGVINQKQRALISSSMEEDFPQRQKTLQLLKSMKM